MIEREPQKKTDEVGYGRRCVDLSQKGSIVAKSNLLGDAGYFIHLFIMHQPYHQTEFVVQKTKKKSSAQVEARTFKEDCEEKGLRVEVDVTTS